ncbi:hypothetical protein L218DRAFT_188292 [Marasmius fiardii PR-910]|nr:hypothetical protein L218DRAFT_188292 [Marasmius fiardii PR-910]
MGNYPFPPIPTGLVASSNPQTRVATPQHIQGSAAWSQHPVQTQGSSGPSNQNTNNTYASATGYDGGSHPSSGSQMSVQDPHSAAIQAGSSTSSSGPQPVRLQDGTYCYGIYNCVCGYHRRS